jgi:hypothetical protein
MIKRIVFSLILSFIFIQCSLIDPPNQNAEVIREGDQILIKDNTGKKWNVTHAVNNYGFKAEEFQFGLGPFAIPPIIEPKMLSPGEPGYPDPDDNRIVIGISLNGESRAYPLEVLTRHEIADEKFDITHVAIGY